MGDGVTEWYINEGRGYQHNDIIVDRYVVQAIKTTLIMNQIMMRKFQHLIYETDPRTHKDFDPNISSSQNNQQQ
ncbi:4088_t:CDS:2 [Dentiscutata heterogama]|uniref:4088_t:CDS:1 n=1 Tax=Dentiscutata heterogama TaxID=1316150 RepID=A0ACA9K2L3_9GLOM|nr:4088_t:CDS:2 [Dentiscutata heterogama]